MSKTPILCVDDEINVLEGIKDNLRKAFRVHVATSGAEGLALLEKHGPFPVVVSDMRMPEMDGARFLAEVRRRAPDTVRVLLTGQADLESAIAAVNEGEIFRFLAKPCPPETLQSVLEQAVDQHRLKGLEKELLESTVRACVETLVEVLQLTNPVAFSRTHRIRRYVVHMAKVLDLPDRWRFEIAALLCQIGYVTLPSETLRKRFAGQALDPEERELIDRHPETAHRLLAKIPRLESIAAMILQQRDACDDPFAGDADAGSDAVAERNPRGETGDDDGSGDDEARAIRLGAALLKTATELDGLFGRGLDRRQALERMRDARDGRDSPLLDALATLPRGDDRESMVLRTVGIDDLTRGMVLDEDLADANGMLLMAAGQDVTDTVMQRLEVFSKRGSLPARFRVRVRR